MGLAESRKYVSEGYTSPSALSCPVITTDLARTGESRYPMTRTIWHGPILQILTVKKFFPLRDGDLVKDLVLHPVLDI